MGNQNARNSLSRRDVLKLAGTAAAFCASFGFLHGGQAGRVVQDKHLQMKWAQAQIKWYRGNELLHSSAIPANVLKYLQADETAVIEIKLFRSGNLLRNLGTIEGKF
ncbi:MAG: twin-arginine translocation signal domain-containing protein [Acidobacteriota bacterium]